MKNFDDKASELMKGGYDLHIHTLPSVFPRSLDCFQLVKEASQAEMKGVVLKSHYESTVARAILVNQYGHAQTKAYGAVALNWPVGGLNVYAVENALRFGAKIIWMPTRDAANSLTFGNMSGDFFDRPGITVLDQKGHLKNCVYEIMDVVKRYGATLASGHLSPEESVILCKEGRRRGVRMVLTHPEFSRTIVPAGIQEELAKEGVFIEKVWLNVVQRSVSIEQMASTIRRIGSSSAFITTDRGQKGSPHPTIEMHRFVCALLEQGLKDSEIRDLIHNVPEVILGLE
ncbi:MAG: DUF6282 family protein [Oscillospiraceae bacterium]|nr:DUF6282 family protein [Oscillospiraceae bacterium]MCI2191419.1 DUF6282 family protein [Oscillospiraceae bacterium]MCI2205788.1 DUF6282 family protein [Oscillospiraceae bacterium]